MIAGSSPQATLPFVQATLRLVQATHPVVQATLRLVQATHPVVQATHPFVQAAHPEGRPTALGRPDSKGERTTPRIRCEFLPFVLLTALSLAACKHTPDTPDGSTDAGLPDAGSVADAGPQYDVITPNTQGWWRDRVFYEVFVRSFADSDGDGIGDFKGLTAKLDYLNDNNPETTTDLGITGLWLMPVFPSPSYHGYDVTDYRGINPDYGTLADFDAFLAAAKARGIKVVLDFVINHSSTQHPWFRNAREGEDATYRDYYSWWTGASPPSWQSPWNGGPVWHRTASGYYYALFWEGMPDLNLGHPDVEAQMLGAQRFWLDRGVDGFRIDAARHLFETPDGQLADVPASHTFQQKLRHDVHGTNPDALWVAEAWSSDDTIAEYYGQGNEYQLAFNFGLAGAIRTAVNDGLRADLSNHFGVWERAMVGQDPGFSAPFLANHDMRRIMRQLAGDAQKMRVAAALLFAQTGTPFVYYGEEIGMQGGAPSNDEEKRTPFRFNATAPGHGFTTKATTWYGTPTELPGVDVDTQQSDPASLWHLFRKLIALRQAEPALARGDALRPTLTGGGRGAWALVRTFEGKRAMFVVNLHSEPTGAFTVAGVGTPRVLYAEGLDSPPTSQDGQVAISGLAARSFAFLALD